MRSVVGRPRAKGVVAVGCWSRKSFGRSWRFSTERSIPSLLHLETSASILAYKSVAMSEWRTAVVVGGLRGKWKDEASTSCLQFAFSLNLFGTSSIKHHLRDLNKLHQFIHH